jgi:hypothetical protein
MHNPAINRKRRRGLAAIATATFIAAFPATSFACDTRHAYNNSAATWIITFSNDSRCSIGGARMAHRCPVGPGKTAELHYDATILGPTNIILSNVRGDFRRSYYYTFAECYLQHSGDTGPFVLNDPANGDVQFIGAR